MVHLLKILMPFYLNLTSYVELMVIQDDAHKLRLFPATLKGSALKWFMGLGENFIAYWETMRKIFLKKYQAYCRPRNSKEDIFRMSQQEDESLEDYLERFLYNLQKSKHSTINLDLTVLYF
jgi:hypothetical protein